MDLGLKNKVALVTGASRGIGRAVAFALAEEGASLGLCSRNAKEIREVAEAIVSTHRTKVHAEALDLTEPGAAEQFIDGSFKALGKIDILVNNVGAGVTQPFDKLSRDEWQGSFEKNFWVAARCCRAVLPMMRGQGSGSIVNMAALSGKIPRRGQIASNVAKAALINLTESLACEVGPYGIRVNAVCPAAVLTARWKERVERLAQKRGEDYNKTLKDVARRAIPIGRFGLPEDVAALVAFLASEKSAFINGVAIEVDGGLGRLVTLEIE